MATSDMRTIYIGALQNTHALEAQAMEIMQRQIERYQNYPELAQALQVHMGETEQQRERLERALASFDTTPSTVKETVLGVVGNLMALGHVPASDEVLKNIYANNAFENYEVAAYRSLITIAEAAGRTEHVALFRQSLAEEEKTARLMESMIVPITQRYLALSVTGADASR